MMQMLFFAACGAVLFVAAVAVLRVTPVPLLAAIGALALAASVLPPRPVLVTGGTAVYSADLLALTAAAAAVPGFRHLREHLGGRLLVVAALAGILLINLARGWALYGQAAVNDVRPLLYLYSVVAYVLSIDLSRWRTTILRSYVLLALALSLLAAVRWRARGFGSSDELVYISEGVYGTTRGLLASQAIIVAVGAVIVLYRWAERRRRADLLLAGWLVTVVLLLQHRSVWAATIASVLGFLNVRPDIRRRVFAAVIVAIVVAAPLLVSRVGGGAVDELAESASTASLTGGTFRFRTEGWAQLIASSRASGADSVALGQPFGTPLHRTIAGRAVAVSAHNFYVSLYLRAGVIGVALLLFLVVAVSRGEPSLRLALVMAVATYGVAYSVDYLIGPIAALVLVAGTGVRSAVQGDASAQDGSRSPEAVVAA